MILRNRKANSSWDDTSRWTHSLTKQICNATYFVVIPDEIAVDSVPIKRRFISDAAILRDTVTTTFPFMVCPASIAKYKR
jgi:hypothetical protein